MPIKQQTAEEAYSSVLAHAGCSLKRDAVDARIIEEVRNGTATYGDDGIIDSQTDVGGWPELKSTTAPTDTDHDGMPDEWEIRKNLDPKNADDRNNVAADGYTMLEKYLNSID
jgi:pectate lyase